MLLTLFARPSHRGLAQALLLDDMDGFTSRGACIRLADVGRPRVIEYRDVGALGCLGRQSRRPGLVVSLGVFAISRLSRFACFRFVSMPGGTKKARVRNMRQFVGGPNIKRVAFPFIFGLLECSRETRPGLKSPEVVR
jgi:hypothetical protein